MQLNLRLTYSICSERVDAPKYFTAQGASHCNFVLVKIIYEHIILFFIYIVYDQPGDLFIISGPLFHGEYEMQDPKSPEEV